MCYTDGVLGDARDDLNIRFLHALRDGEPRTGWEVIRTFPDAQALFSTGATSKITRYLLKKGFVTCKANMSNHTYKYVITPAGRTELQLALSGHERNIST
jgi:DNA-binding PadR family transcriptional regulator